MSNITAECCKEFNAEVKRRQIEIIGDEVHVNGCCGGGCYVLTDLNYCPWCGTKLLKQGASNVYQS